MSGWRRNQGRLARPEGYGSEWKRLRLQVLKRDCHICQCEACRKVGRVKPANEVDHIVPKAKGGTDSLSNFQAINSDCHKLKTQLDNGATPMLAR